MTTNYYDPNTLIFIQSRAESDPALVEEWADDYAIPAYC